MSRKLFAGLALLTAALAASAAETIFDLSTYPQQYEGKTVKVKCRVIARFAGGFFCDDGSSGGDVVEIDPDSVDKDSLKYLMAHCNEASAQCSGSVTGRFEPSKLGDLYIRDASFRFNKSK